MNQFRSELRDAVTPRAFALVVGVLLLQLGFILSYVGAFHAPKPHRIPVGLVAPAASASTLAAKLNALPGTPLSVRIQPDEAAARRRIEAGSLSAALVVNPAANTDELLLASGGGTSIVTAVQAVIAQVEQSQSRSVRPLDLVPVQGGDGRGLSGFYLVVGWMVGGYLVASLLGIAGGARPATLRRAAIRLAALLLYAIVSGFGGALVVGPVLGALHAHVVALAATGALVVFASAAATMALQVLFGVIGIGVAVLLFVVLGNPSAGGAYQPGVLPPFWRAIGAALPNGAGTDTVRRIVYFHGHGIGGHLVVLTLWAVLGAAVALGAAARLGGRRNEPVAEPPA